MDTRSPKQTLQQLDILFFIEFLYSFSPYLTDKQTKVVCQKVCLAWSGSVWSGRGAAVNGGELQLTGNSWQECVRGIMGVNTHRHIENPSEPQLEGKM